MRRWVDIFRILVATLLILQVSAVYAMPAGLHLNLCIGFDGHIDISQDGCAIKPTQQHAKPHAIQFDEDHHDDCLDIAIG